VTRSLSLLALAALLFFSPGSWAVSWESIPEAVDTTLQLEAPPRPPGHYISLQGTYATFHGRTSDQATLERLAAHAALAIPRIAERLGIGAGRHIEITLADDERVFRTLQPGTPPSWADGTAYPQRALVYLKSPSIRPGTAKPLEQVLDHEITHVLLGQAFGAEPVPRWLQEGLAQWVAGEITPELPARIARHTWGGSLLTLDDLTDGFPADPLRADLAYAQSADLIAYVADEYGPETIPVLVQAIAAGQPVRAAFRTATGESAEEIDRAWRGRLTSGHIELAAFGNDMLWFGLGAPLVLFAFWGVRRRNRLVLARWAREEEAEERLMAELFERYQAQG
jgi:hypothetical protein